MAAKGASRLFAIAGGGESSDSDDSWDVGFLDHLKQNSEKHIVEDDKEETLKRALTSGDVRLCEELLNAGVDVESRFKFGWTPLMYAASVANLEMARLLLDRGANASFDKEKFTILMAACTARSSEESILKCVELLLSRNANPNAACRKKMTPIMFAAREGHSQVIALLVAHAAEINLQDENGYTALTWAARQGHKSAVLKLLELGADKSLQTIDGKTPGEVANKHKHPELFSMLSLSSNSLHGRFQNLTKEEAIYKYLKAVPDGRSDQRTSSFSAYGDVEVFLHGLDLEHLSELLKDSEVSLRQLLTMTEDDFEKIGITNIGDQKKIFEAIREMQVEEIRFGDLPELMNIESSTDEFFTFLLKLNRQFNYLTTAVENINKQIPTDPHKIVLEWDATQNFTSVSEDLVSSVENLGIEICKLRDLLRKLQNGQQNVPCRVPPLQKQTFWTTRKIKKFAVTLFGFGLLFLLNKLTRTRFAFL
ncbi:ankyrin repeat, SAM and basic leucine zipper domain-containing protein 1 [Pleurodeles waltl]|uniref:ankyrin repeat, SAM and basic leucine zipper domain-containing protein 1 n=1 Tax=Pleurodeles waltl TaxID=8319 RepID=UPI0037095D94